MLKVTFDVPQWESLRLYLRDRIYWLDQAIETEQNAADKETYASIRTVLNNVLTKMDSLEKS